MLNAVLQDLLTSYRKYPKMNEHDSFGVVLEHRPLLIALCIFKIPWTKKYIKKQQGGALCGVKASQPIFSAQQHWVNTNKVLTHLRFSVGDWKSTSHQYIVEHRMMRLNICGKARLGTSRCPRLTKVAGICHNPSWGGISVLNTNEIKLLFSERDW